MVIRHVVSRAAVGLVAMGLCVAVSGGAFAQQNVLKECGSRYQAKKAANELAGQSWQDFLKDCRASLAEPAAAPAEAAKPAEAAPPAETAKPAEAPTPAEAPKPAETAKPAEPAPAAPTTAAPAAPAAPAEAAKPETKETKATVQTRQKKCAAEWKAQKAQLLKADKKLTWPKFWSACNKRLKAAGE